MDGRWLVASFELGWLMAVPAERASAFIESCKSEGEAAGTLLAPVERETEVWASGVTYMRSREARMHESDTADIYDKVYDAQRPELFFKATPHRVVGPGEPVRIRSDSAWNVPEPELTLAVTADGRRFGYTIGNDMSSRDIEGENPLYLPQAKTYDGCAGGHFGSRHAVAEDAAPLRRGEVLPVELRKFVIAASDDAKRRERVLHRGIVARRDAYPQRRAAREPRVAPRGVEVLR